MSLAEDRLVLIYGLHPESDLQMLKQIGSGYLDSNGRFALGIFVRSSVCSMITTFLPPARPSLRRYSGSTTSDPVLVNLIAETRG